MFNIKQSLIFSQLVVGFGVSGVLNAQDVSSVRKTPSAREGQVTVGARLGMVSVDSIDSSLGTYGIFTDYTVDNRVVVGGSLDYWGMSTGNISDDKIAINDLALGGNGKFIFTGVKATFKPYVLAGISGHRISTSQYESSGDTNSLTSYREKNNEISTELGFDAGGGGDLHGSRAYGHNWSFTLPKTS